MSKKQKSTRAQLIAAAAKKAMFMALRDLRAKATAIAAWFAMPKSRGRKAAEIAVWSAVVFVLFFGYRIYFNHGSFSRWWGCLSAALPFHSLDYSLGFIARALSGQILTLFAGETLTGQNAAIYLITVHVITYGLFSVVMGTMIEKAFRTKNYLVGLFPLLIIFAPPPIWFFGFFLYLKYDELLLLFSLISFFLIRSGKEKLQWFVPVCVCLGILANPTYMLFFFPFVFALLYYEFIKSGRKRTRLSGLIVTTASSFALEIYMLWTIIHQRTGKHSHAEIIAFIERKIGYTPSNAVSGIIGVTSFGVDSTGAPLSPTIQTFMSPYGTWFNLRYYLNALVICLPILIFTLAVWRKLANGEKGFWNKSPYCLFMLDSLLLFLLYPVFSDIDRLAWSILMTQVLLLAYIFIADKQGEAFAQLKRIVAGKKGWITFALLLLNVIIPLIVFNDWQWLCTARCLTLLPWESDSSTAQSLFTDPQWTVAHSIYFLAQVLLLAYVLITGGQDGAFVRLKGIKANKKSGRLE